MQTTYVIKYYAYMTKKSVLNIMLHDISEVKQEMTNILESWQSFPE